MSVQNPYRSMSRLMDVSFDFLITPNSYILTIEKGLEKLPGGNPITWEETA